MANVQHDYRYGPDGPERVYRKTRPAEHRALLPEEAWVERSEDRKR